MHTPHLPYLRFNWYISTRLSRNASQIHSTALQELSSRIPLNYPAVQLFAEGSLNNHISHSIQVRPAYPNPHPSSSQLMQGPPLEGGCTRRQLKQDHRDILQPTSSLDWKTLNSETSFANPNGHVTDSVWTTRELLAVSLPGKRQGKSVQS